MTIENIREYLNSNFLPVDCSMFESVSKMLEDAQKQKNNNLANELWCLKEICNMRTLYVDAVRHVADKEYLEAWHEFDQAAISINVISDNLQQERAGYRLKETAIMIKQWQDLFPYRIFMSRVFIVTESECSICHAPIKLRGGCNHIPGKLYNGELCFHIIKDGEFKGMDVVIDPADKYTVPQSKDIEYDYTALETVMDNLPHPFYPWSLKIERFPDPQFITEKNLKVFLKNMEIHIPIDRKPHLYRIINITNAP